MPVLVLKIEGLLKFLQVKRVRVVPPESSIKIPPDVCGIDSALHIVGLHNYINSSDLGIWLPPVELEESAVGKRGKITPS